ncbi:prenyltransferase [Paucihalobacter ruber]|uniref:Prenyltransferase n=1 Tax=Paucihalobacter ruber TaxID=2567861 RepID=A0A506PGW5_9FLAO|nr:geranylgeranylglycerol-phosphate geranylgeranyltransferase [Paucihalobacter ruber]TPV32342.1 prenyltransferase [Paucihalobacter ruber]
MNKLKYFLKLVRWPNLLMLALMQCLIKFSLLIPEFGVQSTLNWYGFSLLVLSTVCLAAAGYIINDIQDVEADQINNPNRVIIDKHLSSNLAFNWYLALNLLGVLLGFIVAQTVEKSAFFVLFIIISAVLYLYATYLKYIFLVGHLTVSLLVGFSILIVGVFELLPVLTPENRSTQLTIFKILLDYAIFAFILNFIRELIKSVEDIQGDYKVGVKSLPILVGTDRAVRIIFALSLLPVFGVIYYVFSYLNKQNIAIIYFVITVILPLIYCSIQLFSAKAKKTFSLISLEYKIIMLFGMLSMLLYKFLLA